MLTLTAHHPSQGIVRLNFDAPSVEEAVRLAESQGYRVVSSGGFALPSLRITRPKRFPLTMFSQELPSRLLMQWGKYFEAHGSAQ
ncbi:hypothetical protein [Ferriphaselus sp. R-1]|uniref:hypothetical protein n=1 Tax=Ferriphaselus sp. R-1 TaxID=1485544 RepID=UPI00054D3EB7|nr:hypothetical protein [Ferriphaselus sp. R-1]